MHEHIAAIAEGRALTEDEAADAMHQMMSGEAEPEHIAALLIGMRARGEQLDELVGFTRVMREFAVSVDCADEHAIDVCGTGGDGANTFNISTTASFVCAGAGVTVAKHGNRSVSSKSGSADVLETLGIEIELEKPGVEYCLEEAGIAFLFAPYFHPAMKHVMPVRTSLSVRTCFNILGPLCNPANVSRQLVGAFDMNTAQLMVQILRRLGSEHVITVHSNDGMDEFSVADANTLFEYDADSRHDMPIGREVGPEKHGFDRAANKMLRGGDAHENAEILRGILAGTDQSPRRDVVLLNAGYALHTSGQFDDLDAAFDAARASIQSGRALNALNTLIEASNDAPK